MSLLEQALNALGDHADDKASDWFDKLVAELDEQIDKAEDETLKEGGKAAVDVLKAHQGQIMGLGRKSLTLFVGHVAAGKTDEATKEYYRSKASAQEIIDSILDDAHEVNEARKEAEALKQEALDLVKSLAQGAKFLLPLLLGLL
jgi:hypothetical protein